MAEFNVFLNDDDRTKTWCDRIKTECSELDIAFLDSTTNDHVNDLIVGQCHIEFLYNSLTLVWPDEVVWQHNSICLIGKLTKIVATDRYENRHETYRDAKHLTYETEKCVIVYTSLEGGINYLKYFYAMHLVVKQRAIDQRKERERIANERQQILSNKNLTKKQRRELSKKLK